MTTEHAPFFGALLKYYRRAAGLTQEALAARAGISVRGLQDLERRVEQTPRRGTVELLVAALGLSAEGCAALMAAARPRPLAMTGPFPSMAPSSAGLAPLVGRHDEVALLQGFLDGAGTSAAPPAPVLLLAGEPGIGKTRLLQTVARQAIAQGWSVLTGGCHRRGGQEPYSPLIDALAGHIQARSPDRVRAALVGCAWLVRLLPELAGALDPLPVSAPLPAEQERRLMYAAVARFLSNVAGPAGALLVLDDLQWAGSDALDLLAALLRAPAAESLRVVEAYRDTEVRPDDALGQLRADLAQAGLLRHHALGPLAPDDAADLLADLLAAGGARAPRDPTVIPHVLERAGGTPFFLVSYAQALHAAQGPEQGPGPALTGLNAVPAVPWDVAEGVRQRMALLPVAGREILGVAAIVGRRVPRTLLVAVAGQPEEVALVGLEAACRARLLLEDGDDAYAFAHDVIREVVEADVGAARRAVLHRKVAEALEGDPGGALAELLAYHYARASVKDRVLHYLEQAGDQAWDQRAHAAAERHYRELLDALERLGRAPDALRVREKLAEVLYQTGRYEAAITVLGPAADAFRASDDLEGLGRVAAQIGWMYTLLGKPRPGLALVQPLVAQLESGGAPRALPALYTAWGQLLLGAGQYEASLAANERALALVGADGDPRIRVRAAYFCLAVFQVLGRIAEAMRVGQELLPLAETAGHLNILLGTLRDVSDMHALRGDIAASRACIDRASLLARQLADPGVAAYTLAQQAWVMFLCGDGPGAAATLEEALALSRQASRSWYAPHPLLFGARIALAEGAWMAATASAQEALALAAAAEDLQAPRWASAVIAEIEVLEGRPEAASARLVPLLDRPGLEECDVTLLLPVLAWAYLEQGLVAQATSAVAQALARARREHMRLVLVEALRVQALIALRREQWEEAARSLAEGLTLARAMPYPYAEARLLHVVGLLHIAKDELAPARAHLEVALDIFQRLGARWDAARAAQDIAALTVRGRRGPRRGGVRAMPARSASRV